MLAPLVFACTGKGKDVEWLKHTEKGRERERERERMKRTSRPLVETLLPTPAAQISSLQKPLAPCSGN